MQERLAAPDPETWRPDDPKTGHARLLIGELVAVQEGRTTWGQRQIAIVRDGEGQLWNVWLLNTVLVDEFLRQQPKLGEMLAIAYDGRVQRADAPDYEKYRLVVDRPNGNVEWRATITPGGDTPAPAAPAATAAPAPAPAAEPQFVPAAQPAPDDAPVEQNLCAECGYANGRHAQACTYAIPF